MRGNILVAGWLAFVAVAPLHAQSLTEWNDPAVFQLNREAAHTLELPQATADYQTIEQSPFYMSLNGTWQFQWQPNPDAQAQPWTDISVPCVGCSVVVS